MNSSFKVSVPDESTINESKRVTLIIPGDTVREILITEKEKGDENGKNEIC